MNRRNFIIAGVVLAVVVIFFLIPKKDKAKGQSALITTEEATEDDGQRVDVQKLYEQAVALKNDGKLLDAKEIYRKILSDYSDFENIEALQKELEAINMRIIFSNTLTPTTVVHQVVSGDTLGELSKKYGTTVDLIKINNNLKSDIIRIGQKLRIWTGTFNIFVDKSQNILILKQGDEILKVYDVSTGENNSTPVGEFTITTKLVDPVWFNRGVVVPPESPENVLGSRWLGFDIPGYGIHGTVEPETIGQQVTAGCVRMRNKEVEELYSIIPLKTKVVVVD